jgi:SAM-dependent methyltransferase
MQIIDQSSDAFQLTVQDPDMRFYLQRFPFLMGPDGTMNQLGREAVLNGLAPRNRARVATVVHRLMPQETELTTDQAERLRSIMDKSGVPEAARAEMIDDYGWEAKLVPQDVKDALVIGCANGTELMFLRAVLPNANITAIDYEDEIPEARKRAIGLRFFQGDMNALLESFGQEFDLISSNHTLEHLYTLDEVLATLAGLLRPNGALISTLPMDGMDGSPFLEKVKDAVRRRTIHPLDIVYLDAGHPWKTNPRDIDVTFQEVGFAQPLLYQRQLHLSRFAAYGEKWFKVELALGRTLHTLFFGGPRSIAKVLFPKNPPRILVRVLLGLERRVWFGSNILKNRFTQEVLVLARKNSTTM